MIVLVQSWIRSISVLGVNHAYDPMDMLVKWSLGLLALIQAFWHWL